MAEPPGIVCQGRDPRNANDGTLCAAQSPQPGVQGERGFLGSLWDGAVSDATWLGNTMAYGAVATYQGVVWTGSETLVGMEWAGGEIASGAQWSWGEIRGGAVWIGNKAYDAYKYLLSLIDKVKNAADWKTLAAIAEPILGPTFMQAGVLTGIVESLGKDVLSLLELGKMVVLAGLYELMVHPQAAMALAMNPATLPMALTALALKAAASRIPGLATELKKSDDQLKKMLNDLLGIVKDPLGFAKALGRQIKQETLDDWNKLKYYAEHRTLTNDFETGRIYGRVLYQVVMLILLVLSVAGAVAKLAARVPWLLRAARILKTGGEVEDLVETEKVVQGTKTAEDIEEAKKIPKKQSEPEKDPGVNKQTVQSWKDSLETRNPAGSNMPNARDFQIRNCGDQEYLVKGGGEQVWADGVNSDSGLVEDAKYVGDPNKSPFVPDSSVPPKIRNIINNNVEDEFQRYAAVINDPNTPVTGLQVITNEPRAVPYFQNLLQKYGIPGNVVVKP